MKKAQVALEFMTTYAWAFIAILLSIGTLYYFGFLDIGSLGRDTCLFPPQFSCVDFVAREDEVRISLVNNLGESVGVDYIDVTSENDLQPSCTLNSPPTPDVDNPYVWAFSNTTEWAFACTPGVYSKGDAYDFIISFSYNVTNSPSGTPHVMRGKISGTTVE